MSQPKVIAFTHHFKEVLRRPEAQKDFPRRVLAESVPSHNKCCLFENLNTSAQQFSSTPKLFKALKWLINITWKNLFPSLFRKK